jgi:uncharacterized protein (UPF0276 family)
VVVVGVVVAVAAVAAKRSTNMTNTLPSLGLGIGWRQELALLIAQRTDLGFVELTSENHPTQLPLPPAIQALRQRGVTLVPHGLALSLGSAQRPEARRVQMLAEQAVRLQSPLISEHIAFVRSGEEEAGHLLAVPRTRDMVRILSQNIREVMAQLPVPLALENIATLVEWPDAELAEHEFLREVLDGTGAMWLLDVENLYANSINHRFDAAAYIDSVGAERIAYCHMAGGTHGTEAYHDTHAHPIPREVFELLAYVVSKAPSLPGCMLERDGAYDDRAGINAELDTIAATMRPESAMRTQA